MKSYKLIKTYPGSPELGTIEEPVHNNVHMMSNGRYGYDFSKHKEFWEPVVEKDYEILEVITNNGKFIEKVYNQDATIEPYWKIYSIRRKKDGEIFTIGDKIFPLNKICEFEIVNDKLKIYHCDESYSTPIKNGPNNMPGNTSWLWLKDIKKHKQPLFTTEDGVDIFEGDTYVPVYYCNKNGFKLEYTCKKDIKPGAFSKNNYYFSTKEAAEEYILINKPCLSLNDIIEEVNSHRDTNNFQTSQIASWLKELANLKING